MFSFILCFALNNDNERKLKIQVFFFYSIILHYTRAITITINSEDGKFVISCTRIEDRKEWTCSVSWIMNDSNCMQLAN